MCVRGGRKGRVGRQIQRKLSDDVIKKAKELGSDRYAAPDEHFSFSVQLVGNGGKE